MATSVVSALRWWAHAKGDETALIVEDEQVSYRELQEWSSRFGRLLAERGVSAGDRVGVTGGNSLEWCVAALGVLKAGGVVVPLNHRLVPAEMHKILGDAGATAVVTDPEVRSTVQQVAELGADLDLIDFDAVNGVRTGAADDFVVDVDPDEPAMIIFTSGTTGLSKGVICTNRMLLNIVFEATLMEEGLRPGTSILLLLPLAFTPGLVWGLSMNTVLGGKLVIERDLDPSRAVRLLERHRIQALFGVPLIFERMAAAPEFADADLSSLKTILTGGAPVPVPLLKAWGAKGARLRQIYGMTEVGGVATSTLPADAFEHPDSCGTGSIFTEFKVIRQDGTECEPGEPGEVILQGPGMTPGYYNDPDNTARAIRDGWLYSGDLGVRDEEGRLKFLDRMKDLIITGGINVSPVEIERVISTFDGIEEVAVIPATDERFGETPAAIVKARGEVDVQALIDHCNKNLADYKVPRYVVVRDEPLPRLPSGKLAKTVIREEYAEIAKNHPKVR